MGLLARLLGRTAKKAWPDFGSFDDVTRLPVNATREVGAGGLPVSPSQPFRNSLRGGSDDLMEAARPKGLLSRAAADEEWIPVYRGLEEPWDGQFRAGEKNWYPETVSTSRTTDAANFYARKTSGGPDGALFGEGANVMPLEARGPFAPVEEFEALTRQYMGGGAWSKAKEDAAVLRAIAELRNRGYSGLVSEVDDEVAVFVQNGASDNLRPRFRHLMEAARPKGLLSRAMSEAPDGGALATRTAGPSTPSERVDWKVAEYTRELAENADAIAARTEDYIRQGLSRSEAQRLAITEIAPYRAELNDHAGFHSAIDRAWEGINEWRMRNGRAPINWQSMSPNPSAPAFNAINAEDIGVSVREVSANQPPNGGRS